jgi:hypothetical protein
MSPKNVEKSSSFERMRSDYVTILFLITFKGFDSFISRGLNVSKCLYSLVLFNCTVVLLICIWKAFWHIVVQIRRFEGM